MRVEVAQAAQCDAFACLYCRAFHGLVGKKTASSESPRKQISKALLSAGWCGEGIGEKEILCKRVSLQARAITITSMLSHLECEMARSISVASIMFERVWLPFKFA